MSNFLKKGKREDVKSQKKDVKKRIKRIYQIMDELDNVAALIFMNKEDYTEENIKDIAGQYTDLTIEGMETMMLLGKLQNLEKHYEDKEIPDNVDAIRRGSFVTAKEVSE
jgi:hypothetical protein